MVITLVPVAHVSKRSVNLVKRTILLEKPEFVAIELDHRRLAGIVAPKQRGRPGLVSPLFLALYFLQQAVGRIVHVMPGSEMRMAIFAASKVKAKIVPIDQDILITMRRAGAIPLWEKLKMAASVPASILVLMLSFRKEKQIEELTTQKQLEEMLAAFRTTFPAAYRALIAERDVHMAAQLAHLSGSVVAVIGAGHLPGLLAELKKRGLTARVAGASRPG